MHTFDFYDKQKSYDTAGEARRDEVRCDKPVQIGQIMRNISKKDMTPDSSRSSLIHVACIEVAPLRR